MEKKKLRVLMLGWEFPPFLNGGLGKASYGLAQALSEYVDLTLVVPKAVPGSFGEKWRTIGLHDVNLIHPDTNQPLPALVSYLDADLDPYTVDHLIQQLPHLNPHQRKELYDTSNNYGPHLLTKVANYTETVLELAQSMPFDVVHAHDWMTFPAALQIQQQSNPNPLSGTNGYN